MFRVTFVLACSLFWLCAIAGGLELWARWFPAAVPSAPNTICFSLAQARETYTSVYERFLKPWPAPMPTLPPIERYGMQDDAQRQATAETRGEWAVLVDSEFRVVRTYGAAPADHGEWAAHATPGCPLASLADARAGEEMQGRLKSLFEGGFGASMHVDLPPEGSAGAARMDARFVPVRHDRKVRQAIVAFRPSVWMPGGKKHFAPRVSLIDNADIMMMERFTTNNLGYRGPDVAIPKPAGRLRIVCVGGSTTVSGYDDRMTYPAMLQCMLREKFSQAADRIEVVNCGIFGLVSAEELEMQPEILAMEPDIILYYNGINDLTTHYRAWLASDEAWSTAGDKLRRWLGRSVFVHRFWNAETIPGDADFGKMIQSSSMDNLEKLYMGYQEHGAAVVACSFSGPDPDALSPDDRLYADTQFVPQWFFDMNLRSYTHVRRLFNAALKDLCARKNLVYLPVAEEHHAGFDQFTDLCHMTPQGIENKARIVFNHIAPLVGERLGKS